LHTLRIDTIAPLAPQMQWLAASITLRQSVSLIISMEAENWSPELLKLAEADAALAQFNSIGSVTLILVPQKNVARERDLIDVSRAFANRMPSLAGKGALRVLRSS
jgi:hypothetical protein